MLDPRRLRPAPGGSGHGDGADCTGTDWRLAVDIGGTFTDVVLLDAATGTVVVDKTLTTPSNPLDGVRAGVGSLLARAGVRPVDITAPIVHATTLITNALIERKTGRAGLVTTAGFGDTLLIRDEHRYDMYDLQIEFPAPPIPRALTFELDERTGAGGEVLRTPEAACAGDARRPTRCGRKRRGRRDLLPQLVRRTPTTSGSSPTTCVASSACRCASRPRCRPRSASTRG